MKLARTHTHTRKHHLTGDTLISCHDQSEPENWKPNTENWLLTILTVQLVNLLGSAAGDGALYADGNGYHQNGYRLDDVRIDGCFQAALKKKKSSK